MTSFTRHCARDHSVIMRPHAGDQIRTYIVPGRSCTRVKVATHSVVYGRPLPAAALLEQITAAREDVFMAPHVIYEFGPEALENPVIVSHWPTLRQSVIRKLECARNFDFELVTRMPRGCTFDTLFGLGNVAVKYVAIGRDRCEVIQNIQKLDYFKYTTRSPVTVVTRDAGIHEAANHRGIHVTEDL